MEKTDVSADLSPEEPSAKTDELDLLRSGDKGKLSNRLISTYSKKWGASPTLVDVKGASGKSGERGTGESWTVRCQALRLVVCGRGEWEKSGGRVETSGRS